MFEVQMCFWGVIANLSQFLRYVELSKLCGIFREDVVKVPHMNIKRYINQREFESFNIILSRANKCSVYILLTRIYILIIEKWN